MDTDGPVDVIIFLTDCPYLAPAPNRGKRNSSLNIPYVVSALADIKGIDEEAVRQRPFLLQNVHCIPGRIPGMDNHRLLYFPGQV